MCLVLLRSSHSVFLTKCGRNIFLCHHSLLIEKKILKKIIIIISLDCWNESFEFFQQSPFNVFLVPVCYSPLVAVWPHFHNHTTIQASKTGFEMAWFGLSTWKCSRTVVWFSSFTIRNTTGRIFYIYSYNLLYHYLYCDIITWTIEYNWKGSKEGWIFSSWVKVFTVFIWVSLNKELKA